MNKFSLISHLFLLAGLTGFAQKRTEDFSLDLPGKKISGSHYKKISYLDSREDTTNMGIVQLGAFNTRARVVPEIPFEIQIGAVMDALTDSTAGSGELLFQLRLLTFAELKKSMTEKGYCYFRATLYAKQEDHYLAVQTIDTLILIKSMYVTRAMFRHGSKCIVDFIAGNLLHIPDSNVLLSYRQVQQVDSIEKSRIPLYTANTYADGIYPEFTSFTQQLPERPVTAEIINTRLHHVKSIGRNGKPVNVNPKDIYAVVYQGHPFIATEYGYYALRKPKNRNDFLFVGLAKANAKIGNAFVIALLFGLVGTLMASTEQEDVLFEMKLDHLNGSFVPLREMTGISGPVSDQ